MKIIAFIYFNILKLRYKFNIKGIEHIENGKQYVIFPNHQALVDPQIVYAILGQKIKISPVVTESFYNLPILNLIFKSIGAVSMGDVSKGISGLKEVNAAFKGIEQGIKEGKNIMLYPAGQLYSQPYEVIKGKKSAHNIMKYKTEDTQIIVIKTTGLWGSSWSKAWTGTTPNFFMTLIKGVTVILGNLILFVPKRQVNIEIQNYTDKLENIDNLNDFNQTLEDYYNKDGKDKLNYKKYFFFYNHIKDKKLPKISGSVDNINTIDESIIPLEVKEKIINKASEIKEISNENINIKTNIITELYFDSLDTAEIKAYIQTNFEKSSNPPITELKTIGDLCYMAIGKSENEEELKPCKWSEVTTEAKIYDIINNNINKIGIDNTNILSLFKSIFKNNKSNSFIYDTIFGLQSKKDFLIKAYLISSYIKKIDGKYIGIMLPSVSSSSLLIISTYLSGKVPVMLNWTVGETALLHCVKFAKIDNVLTSKSFYDKAKNDGTEKIKDKYIFLEDMLKDISIFTKIKAVFCSMFFSIPKLGYEDEAVLLFTSGSESLPKAVSLSHKNLISDIKGALYYFPLTNKDKLIGFLPPFHSFGFTINTIMPLISGLNVTYSPDPNDAKTIVELIKHTNISTITATPTFLKMLLQLAGEKDLENIKYAVVGAEKCPETLAKNFEKYCPNGKILEGYGITECSPVISINPPSKPKLGSVGLAIEGSTIKILSLDNNKELEKNKEGMIYYKGDNVFNGYLDNDIDPPFEDIGGERYYKTGDLGYLDNDGYLFITGRLKRFVKIAGEMISLPFIEGILNQKYGSDTELKLAIEAIENNGEVKIVLFAIDNLNLDEVATYMRESGVSNLVKISDIINLDNIPVLGTGKTDYKELKNMIKI